MFDTHSSSSDAHCLPALQDVIGLFAGTADPDYPGHVLLEQYQAQVMSGLNDCGRTPLQLSGVVVASLIYCMQCSPQLKLKA